MKFRKKPVVIEASQFRCDVPAASRNATTGLPGAFMGYPIQCDERGAFLLIPTLEGTVRADSGDWIVTGIKGERYPCKPDIFEATYEAAG